MATTPTFDAATRGLYPALAAAFDQHEKLVTDYDERFRPEYTFEGREQRSIRDKLLLLLLSTIVRARRLALDVVVSVNDSSASGLFSAVRSHYEVAGQLAYAMRCHRRFLAAELAERNFHDTLDGLIWARRHFSPAMEQALQNRGIDKGKLAPPANVVTFIEAVKHATSDRRESDMFKDQYDWLCEYGHPNMLSRLPVFTATGVVFDVDPPIPPDQLEMALKAQRNSHLTLMSCFDRISTAIGGLP